MPEDFNLRRAKAAPPSRCRIETANVDHAPGILALQIRAYQSEARLYDDWRIPPLTQTLDSLRSGFDSTVEPEFQGQGVGTRLMRSVEAAFPAVERFELFTGSRSAANIRLYERLGYRPCREQALSPAVTLVFMEKRR